MSADKRKRKAAAGRKVTRSLAQLEKYAQREIARAKLQGHLSTLAQGAPLNWEKPSADLFGYAMTLLVPEKRLDEIAAGGVVQACNNRPGMNPYGAPCTLEAGHTGECSWSLIRSFHGKRVT